MPARPQPRRVTPAPPKFARAVYALVRRVPRGRVVTYGQVAAILGHPRAARAVGTALSNLPASLKHVVPWQRVINASGGVSARGDVLRPDLQRELLELEGVMQRGRVDLALYRWSGPKREQPVALRVELPLSEGRLRRAGGRRGVKSTRS